MGADQGVEGMIPGAEGVVQAAGQVAEGVVQGAGQGTEAVVQNAGQGAEELLSPRGRRQRISSPPPGADSTHIFSTTETWPTGVSAEQRGETETLPGAVTGTGSRDGNRRETLVRIEENIHPIWFTAPLSCQPPEEEMKERRARAYAHAMGIPYRKR